MDRRLATVSEIVVQASKENGGKNENFLLFNFGLFCSIELEYLFDFELFRSSSSSIRETDLHDLLVFGVKEGCIICS